MSLRPSKVGKACFGDDPIFTALRSKRAELAGEIAITTNYLQELRVALRSFDETLCLFRPVRRAGYQEPKVWRPKADWGEAWRADPHMVPQLVAAGVRTALQPRHRHRVHDGARNG